jgi:uncharacterized RmlC-like cupin family protein
MGDVRVVRAGQMRPSPAATPGMHRQEAFADGGAWAGTVRTEEGVLTGWHIHPGWDTYVYVVSGSARIEYGPGGLVGQDAGPGDFLLIPRGLVHREGTSVGSKGVEAVIVRIGDGELVTNVDGPEPPEP